MTILKKTFVYKANAERNRVQLLSMTLSKALFQPVGPTP